MTVVREIACLDLVELTEPVGDVPAGSRAGVLELRDDGMAMLKIMTMPAEPILDRIVFAPIASLRRIDRRISAIRARHDLTPATLAELEEEYGRIRPPDGEG